MSQKPKFGALIEKTPDYRRVPYSDTVAGVSILPKSYSYNIDRLGKAWHQKKNGSCVGHAMAKTMQVYWYEKTGEIVEFSPRFLYAVAKCMDEYPGEGTYPSLVAKILQKYGCATIATCPNDSDLPHEKYVYNRKIDLIPSEAFEEAAKYKIDGYAFVDITSQDEIRRAIKETGAISVLMRIGEEWWTDKKGNTTWAKDKITPLRVPRKIVSGHEVVGFGWDDAQNIIFNSWSELWADKGRAPYDVASWQPYINEMIIFKRLPREVEEEVKRLPAKPKYTFTRNLKYGMRRDKDVMALQDCLKFLGFMKATTPSTGNYLDETRAAVLGYQLKYKIDSQEELMNLNGEYVGPRTRADLNSRFSK